MPEQTKILEYKGKVDQKLIDQVLKKLKVSKDYLSLGKTTGKRLYAIMVEVLENILKYSAVLPDENKDFLPWFRLVKSEGGIEIMTGNPIPRVSIGSLVEKIEQVNSRDENSLVGFYETTINRETKRINSAGLGFIIIKLKSGNNIGYRFLPVSESATFFEMKIILKPYIMRKLIIDKTSSSPGVILDPEKRIFEISGESRPPDVGNFYGEILTWMEDYSGHLMKTQESRDPVVFNFDFEYFNSSSAKYILDFCKQIAAVKARGKEVAVNWHYEGDDMDMLEVGREMSRMAKVPFEFVKKP